MVGSQSYPPWAKLSEIGFPATRGHTHMLTHAPGEAGESRPGSATCPARLEGPVARPCRQPEPATRLGAGSRGVVVRVSDLQPGEPAPLVCVLARREGLGGRRVTCLRYSQGPDGPGDDGEGGGSERLLAVGTWDGCVLVFASYSCRP